MCIHSCFISCENYSKYAGDFLINSFRKFEKKPIEIYTISRIKKDAKDANAHFVYTHINVNADRTFAGKGL